MTQADLTPKRFFPYYMPTHIKLAIPNLLGDPVSFFTDNTVLSYVTDSPRKNITDRILLHYSYTTNLEQRKDVNSLRWRLVMVFWWDVAGIISQNRSTRRITRNPDSAETLKATMANAFMETGESTTKNDARLENVNRWAKIGKRLLTSATRLAGSERCSSSLISTIVGTLPPLPLSFGYFHASSL